jgi:GNAT superfamily N-acetyltransferase
MSVEGGRRVSRSCVGVTLDNIEELPKQCRRCVYWEIPPHLMGQAEEYGTLELEKEAWVSGVLLEWGSCGRIAHVDGVPAGFAFFAPPAAVPRAAAFPTAPVSADAVLLCGVHVLPDFAGAGLGRLLIQDVVRDLTRRGVKAVEAFGDDSERARAESHGRADDGSPTCVLPAAFLRAVGFKTIAPHHRWPRLRLELRTGLNWKEDVEAAIAQLLGSVTISTAPAAPAQEPAPARASG